MMTVMKYCLIVYKSVAEEHLGDASSTKRDDLHKERLTDLIGHKVVDTGQRNIGQCIMNQLLRAMQKMPKRSII